MNLPRRMLPSDRKCLVGCLVEFFGDGRMQARPFGGCEVVLAAGRNLRWSVMRSGVQS